MPRSIPVDAKYMYTAVVYKMNVPGSIRRFGPYRLEKTAREQVTRWKKQARSAGSPTPEGRVERVALFWEQFIPAYYGVDFTSASTN